MAYYFLSNLTGAREGAFAWYEYRENKYWFNGATFTKDGWVPNPVSWDRYYALTSDQGIGIREDKIALVENGKEVLAVRLDPAKTQLVRYNKFFWWAKVPELIRDGPESWSTWNEIKWSLKTTYPSQESRRILHIMNRWETISHDTVLWVEETLRDQADPQDIVEIYAAGLQWLWHNTTKGVVIAGLHKKIWGSAHLHSGGVIITRGALPIYNGWFVGLDSRNKYLLRQNERGLETSTFIFPYGPWDGRGAWKLWGLDQIVLTPQNQLVIAPELYHFEDDFPHWVLFGNHDSESDWLLINRQGEFLYLDLSEYPGFEETPDIYPRERCMLVEHIICADGREWQSFSLISLSPIANVKRAPEPLWQVKVAPIGGARIVPYHLYIKDGTTEVFAFKFDTYDENWGIGLINERGQFWLSPFFVKGAILDYYVDADGAIKYDRLVVMPSERFSMLRSGPKVIRVSNGQVHIELEPGVTMSDPLISLPEGENSLWSYLIVALGLARATKEWHRLSTIGRTV